ncbi:hypothetical protein [Streptomyces sp. SID13031]|uniref:hypothetical protein n=1 Tax=Streptomyces sp. SID13031 TaxID=2706046 RepID=UPI0013C721D4|nr:hypothetical protein [Streptomyces sp. SID13031]NEA31941.1 hypothetical protein [Streptomyces sp. SID13031]
MGDRSPDAWANELQRDGRVVFSIRPRAVLRELGIIWLIVIVTQAISLSGGWGVGDARPLFALFIVLIAAVVTAWSTSRLATRYPSLTVDESGLRIGRKRSIRWSEVGLIGPLRSGLGTRTFPILPKDVRVKELVIPQTAARDLKALQQWLGELLKEHRSADRPSAESPD